MRGAAGRSKETGVRCDVGREEQHAAGQLWVGCRQQERRSTRAVAEQCSSGEEEDAAAPKQQCNMHVTS